MLAEVLIQVGRNSKVCIGIVKFVKAVTLAWLHFCL